MSVRTLRYNTIEQHFTKSARASTDRDALAFLEAAQIYNTNQQRAIVNLVRSLKRVGLWSKMKAIYPFVGGTATSHKWNLKDPRDVDAAFRLTFSGGWTHSSTGATPNGSNAYANTYFNGSNFTSVNTANISYYSRTNSNGTEVEIGCRNSSQTFIVLLEIRTSGTTYSTLNSNNTYMTFADANSQGYYLVSRTASNSQKIFKNGVSSSTATTTTEIAGTETISIGAFNAVNVQQFFSTKQVAFATIGDGLTDSDATNLYTIVQRYQFQLGRAIEPDAQAFIDAAGITDATQQAAILDLVVRLKNDGLWSKMKAIYPFVGGTASSHKWNLKDPRDVNAAYRLTFSGGWTHSANGADPNGSNAYADTNFDMTNHSSQNNIHCSHYCTDNTASNTGSSVTAWGTSIITAIYPNYLNQIWSGVSIGGASGDYIKNNITDSRAYIIISRIASNEHKQFRNNATGLTNSAVSQALQNYNYYLGAGRTSGGTFYYSPHAFAFATIGDGLTDSDASNLYNIVDLYQKRLGRAV